MKEIARRSFSPLDMLGSSEVVLAPSRHVRYSEDVALYESKRRVAGTVQLSTQAMRSVRKIAKEAEVSTGNPAVDQHIANIAAAAFGCFPIIVVDYALRRTR